jgi:hypothetical protein
MIWLAFLLLLLPIWVAPFETAGWWMNRQKGAPHISKSPAQTDSGSKAQLVYFTGVAGYSGEFLARRESALLERIQKRFPQLEIHSEIFPYSVNNNPLDGERLFRGLWKWLHHWRLRVPNNVFDVLIVIRNVGQLLVSADPRYGPYFNRGLAEVLQNRLSPAKTTIFLAYSGGAQMAVGALGSYAEEAHGSLHLLALGGVFSDDPSIRRFDSVVQLQGSRDHLIVNLGKLIFPGLWKMTFWSAWNRYRASGRYITEDSGPHAHLGASDYFSLKPIKGQDQLSYSDLTFAKLESHLSRILEQTESKVLIQGG